MAQQVGSGVATERVVRLGRGFAMGNSATGIVSCADPGRSHRPPHPAGRPGIVRCTYPTQRTYTIAGAHGVGSAHVVRG